jgi:hypothetical protein
MMRSDHTEMQNMLLAGRQESDASRQAQLEAHLAGCTSCQAFAEVLERLEPRLERSMRAHWDVAMPSRRFTQGILDGHRRRQAVRKGFSLAWLGLPATMVVLLVWAIQVLVLDQPAPAIRLPSAAQVNLSAEDLGPGWTISFDEDEIRPNQYYDVNEQGEGFIGEHANPQVPLFTMEELESFSQRSFYDRDREVAIFTSVAIFKDTAALQRFAESAFPGILVDSSIPEENMRRLEIPIGEQGTPALVSIIMEGDSRFAVSAGFLTEKTGYILFIINHQMGDVPFSEEQVLDLLRWVEVRIPAGY